MTTLSDFNESATDLSAPVDVLAVLNRWLAACWSCGARPRADSDNPLEALAHDTAELVKALSVRCDCIEKLDAELSKHNTRISLSLVLGGPKSGVFPHIGTEAREKRRGFRPIALVPTYCPFCGVSYSPQEAVASEPTKIEGGAA